MKLIATVFSLIFFFATNSYANEYLPILSAKSTEGNLYNRESLRSVMEELLKTKPQSVIKIEYSYGSSAMKETIEREVSLYIKQIREFGLTKENIIVKLTEEKNNKIVILAK